MTDYRAGWRDRQGEAGEVTEPGELGVEELRATAAGHHDDLVVVDRGWRRRGSRRPRPRAAWWPDPPAPTAPSSGAASLACSTPSERWTRAPQSHRNTTGSRSTSRSSARSGWAVRSSTASRSRKRFPPAAYRLIHSTCTPSRAVQADTIAVRQRARRELQQYVVDREPVEPLLDDLDGLDVAAGLTDRGREPAQRTGHVGQLDPQQEGHGSTLGDAHAAPGRRAAAG